MLYNQKREFLICYLVLLTPLFAMGQNLTLQTTGSPLDGYVVNIFNNHKLLVTCEEEFSLEMYNLDYSTEASIPHWKGQTWSGDEKHIILKGHSYIKELDANLSVTVDYKVINDHVVRKEVRLFQPSMPDMHYILKETARPAEKPVRYTSFEYDSFPGGLVHEMFPSAGFITPDNVVVGFLTDAGYKNQYTRNTRRRWSGRGGGFTGWRRLPDPALFSVADAEEQNQNNDYIRQTFGEMYNLDAGEEVELKLPDSYTTENASATVQNKTISLSADKEGRAGIRYIAPFKDQHIYTISFKAKGNKPVSLKMFRIKNGKATTELEYGLKYIDQFPIRKDEWTLFKGSIFPPYIEHDSVSLFIGTQSGKDAVIEIKDLKIVQHQPKTEPYNILPLGEEKIKTTYMFAEPWKSHRQYMISSQVRLAEGKNFKGTEVEKMMYANFNMLTWITDVKDFAPLNVPNMNYAPDMYNRDAFFSTVSTYNKEMNLNIWRQWAKTQTPSGGIGTIITPLMGSVEAKDNEATIEWLMWALLIKRRFGVVLPQDKIAKAVDYVLSEFDEDRDGICKSHFSLSQIDIVDFKPKTDRLAVNQGMLAVALRTIKALGFDISESYIEKAEKGYRDFYDPKRKHLLFDRDYPDLISVTDLEPEFYSIWLFDHKMLTDEMVQHHLDQIPILNKVSNSPHPELGTTAPVLIRLTKDKKGYAYLSKDYQPFAEFGAANYADGTNDGYYYNGGSWLRGEYCAYVTGLKHGWQKATKLMENRLWAEIYLNPKWPFSKEFIPTKWTTTDSWWPSTKGLCWNVFILMANEVAGLRKPEMDPDYKKDVLNK